MRRISTALLTVLMAVFLSLGFYGLFQHVSKQWAGSTAVFQRVR